MIKKNILVVGGGFRGIVIADKLKKSNNVDLIEKLPFIGGILYSEEWNGFFIDKGIHIFDNTNDEDTKLIQKILKNKFRKISVKYGSRINDITSSVVAIPDFTTLNKKTQMKIANELFECSFKNKKSKNLSEYLLNTYGKTAGKYYINLAKKYFAADPKELSPDSHRNLPSRGRFFDDHITSFLKNFKEFDYKLAMPTYNDPMKWHNSVSDKSYRYFYPVKRGLREFCDNAEEYLKKEGINVKTAVWITHLQQNKNKILCSMSDGSQTEYDNIVWTVDPINLYKIITKQKMNINSGIHHVPMIVYYFIVDLKNINDFTYIQDFTNKSIALRGAVTGMIGKQIINNQTYVDVEVPTKITSKIWKNPDQFYDRIWEDIVKMGLVKGKLPKSKKYIKTPISFRALKHNYKNKNIAIEKKIHKFSDKIFLINQEDAQLFKILKSLKTKNNNTSSNLIKQK